MNVRRIPDNSYCVPMIIRAIPRGMYPASDTVPFTVCPLVFQLSSGYIYLQLMTDKREKCDCSVTPPAYRGVSACNPRDNFSLRFQKFFQL